MLKEKYKRLICLLVLALTAGTAMAQQRLTFGLETVSDSLSWLCLFPQTETDTEQADRSGRETGRKVTAKWRLPYPVYQLAAGDVDGDGKEEALVGVTKSTRFYPQPARRLFIFKQVNGKIRPMWMGSRMGGILCDFRFAKPYIRTLQTTTDGKYVVADYAWDDFGLSFVRFLAVAVSREEATRRFLSD